MAPAPQPIYLKDYQPPAFVIDSVELHFDLDLEGVVVTSLLSIKRRAAADPNEPLVLDGEALSLKGVWLEGMKLEQADYRHDEKQLTVFSVPDHFQLETQVVIYPKANTQLTGLYASRATLSTQCEPHGFRRITFFLDRPDVMSRFTTAISGDPQHFPFMLSNGNLVDEKTLSDGRRWVKWSDPSLKPAYLFALVAGDFDELKDTFKTRSDRQVDLRLYVEKGLGHQGQHALNSLKRAMAWDEQTFDREYDLDIYMMVAVSDFNMGAMENKGLNIFNTQYILATPETATDRNFIAVEEVIGHEYFHNWSGNRVTLRDWFQLSLKEGLTIFRDQWFTGDMTGHAVKRIDDVNLLKSMQFPEDAGPTAHPVRPQSYIEMNNFYTLTVYHKGAELIRMMYYLLGDAAFKRAMNLYFQRHDGQAVTTDDFVKAMEDGGDVNLTQFKRWYEQAGTPHLTFSDHFDETTQTYELTVEQWCPDTPGQTHKAPFMIPVAIGLVDQNGQDLPLRLEGEDAAKPAGSRTLIVNARHQQFKFTGIKEKPLPSILRHFSAPVQYHYDYSDEDLRLLYQCDSDDYNRWDAGQRLMIRHIKRLVDAKLQGLDLLLPERLLDTMRGILSDQSLDNRLKARALSLPSISYLTHELEQTDMDALLAVYDFMKQGIAGRLHELWQPTYEALQETAPYEPSIDQIGKRDLKNLSLAYLVLSGDQNARTLAMHQFENADNMTDTLGALNALNDVNYPEREEALQRFKETWEHDSLVMDKWLALQATSRRADAVERVQSIMGDEVFDEKNPNKIRALIASFARRNPWAFHDRSGQGYAFLKEQVLRIDEFNPQIAARLVEPLTQWREYDPYRQSLMHGQLEAIMQRHNTSNDLYEIVSKSLSAKASR